MERFLTILQSLLVEGYVLGGVSCRIRIPLLHSSTLRITGINIEMLKYFPGTMNNKNRASMSGHFSDSQSWCDSPAALQLVKPVELYPPRQFRSLHRGSISIGKYMKAYTCVYIYIYVCALPFGFNRISIHISTWWIMNCFFFHWSS